MKSPVLLSSAKRRLAIASLLLVPTLGACGFGAQTDQVYQAAVGTDYRSKTVDVLNATIVTGADGSGTFAGTLVNKTDEEIQVGPVTGEGITSETGGGEALVIPAGGSNNLGQAGETVPPAKLTIAGAADAIAPGKYVELVFTFSSGDTINAKVPVVNSTGSHADVPLPEPTKSDKKAKKPEAPEASEPAEPDASSDSE